MTLQVRFLVESLWTLFTDVFEDTAAAVVIKFFLFVVAVRFPNVAVELPLWAREFATLPTGENFHVLLRCFSLEREINWTFQVHGKKVMAWQYIYLVGSCLFAPEWLPIHKKRLDKMKLCTSAIAKFSNGHVLFMPGLSLRILEKKNSSQKVEGKQSLKTQCLCRKNVSNFM